MSDHGRSPRPVFAIPIQYFITLDGEVITTMPIATISDDDVSRYTQIALRSGGMPADGINWSARFAVRPGEIDLAELITPPELTLAPSLGVPRRRWPLPPVIAIGVVRVDLAPEVVDLLQPIIDGDRCDGIPFTIDDTLPAHSFRLHLSDGTSRIERL